MSALHQRPAVVLRLRRLPAPPAVPVRPGDRRLVPLPRLPRVVVASAQEWDNLTRKGRFPGLMGRIFEAALKGDDPEEVLRRAMRRRSL